MEVEWDEELTGAEGDAVPQEVRVKEKMGGDCMAKKERSEQPEQVPMKCAFDKDRVCEATCTAFFVVQSASGTQFGCKRMR